MGGTVSPQRKRPSCQLAAVAPALAERRAGGRRSCGRAGGQGDQVGGRTLVVVVFLTLGAAAALGLAAAFLAGDCGGRAGARDAGRLQLAAAAAGHT